MRRSLYFVIVVSILIIVVLSVAGCAKENTQSVNDAKDVLTSRFSKQAPQVDGVSDDKVWGQVSSISIETDDGPDVTMKSIHTKEKIYILASWADDTRDDVDEVWEFDGTEWKKGLIDDAFAIFWNIDDSIAGFNREGCQAICHKENGEAGSAVMQINGPESTDSIWKGAEQKGDIWDISLGISNVRDSVNDYAFIVDPSYLKNPTAIRPRIFLQHDEFTNQAPMFPNKRIDENDGQEKPVYMLNSGLSVEDTPYPFFDQVEEIVDYSIFNNGDRIPYIIFYPFTNKWGGSRDDIAGKGVWEDGHWTVEMERALKTGRDDDIQFDPAADDVDYSFAVAVFDRTIVDHKTSKTMRLVFEK